MIAYFTEIFGPAFGPVIGLAVVLILLALGIWVLFLVIRRFRSGLFISGVKNRAPRLAVTDAVPVDSHRRLVLVRRDDVEHLIMIGGPTDIVVEAGIGKPQPVTQSAAPRIPPQMTQPPAQQQPTAQAVLPPATTAPFPQRSANVAAREAVNEAERGRPVRTPETRLPERRVEPAMVPPTMPTPPASPTLPVQASVPTPPAVPTGPIQASIPATPPVPTLSSMDSDLDKLLNELRPNPLQDR